MRTRNVIKRADFKNLICKEENGTEIEFPDVPEDGTPQVGDKVLVDGVEAETGACTLPDGTAVFWEDGKVTEVDQDPNSEDVKDLKKLSPVKNGVCRAFNTWKDNKAQTVEILGSNEETPFRKGNRVLVNGKVMQLARVEINGKEVKIQNGRISSVKSLSAKPSGSRRVLKPSGKKVTGRKVSEE